MLLRNRNPLALLKPRQVFAKNPCISGRDSFHGQSLRRIPQSGIKISNLSVSRSKCIDHVLVFPLHDAASDLRILDCLLPIAK